MIFTGMFFRPDEMSGVSYTNQVSEEVTARLGGRGNVGDGMVLPSSPARSAA
jgi:hypothetical protein